MCSAANLPSAINGRGRRWPYKTVQTLYWNCLPYFRAAARKFFAAGAVQLLAATGITGYLAFGAETAETQTLAAAAHFINTHQEELRAIIKSGSSYAAAQSTLLQNAGFTFAAAEANDILALEYCRCLQKYAPQIMPLVIRRCGAGYNSSDISAEYASASGIRTEYAAAGLSGRNFKTNPGMQPQTT